MSTLVSFAVSRLAQFVRREVADELTGTGERDQ